LPAGGDFLEAREFLLEFSAAHDKILTLEYRQAMGPTAGMVFIVPPAAFSFLHIFGYADGKRFVFLRFRRSGCVVITASGLCFRRRVPRKQRRVTGGGGQDVTAP
jgi:hypothetical protein